jgi:hypothetical protein
MHSDVRVFESIRYAVVGVLESISSMTGPRDRQEKFKKSECIHDSRLTFHDQPSRPLGEIQKSEAIHDSRLTIDGSRLTIHDRDSERGKRVTPPQNDEFKKGPEFAIKDR